MSTGQSSALIRYEGQPTEVVQGILHNVITESSRKCYDNSNVKLLLWLYEDDRFREDILADWFVEQMTGAEQRDEERNNQRNASTKDSHYYRRLLCKQCLQHVNSKETSPIILSSYGICRSALLHLYRCSGESMDSQFESNLTTFFSGLKRTVAKDRATSGLSLETGKRPMSYDVYKKLCSILFKSEKKNHDFLHLFLTLDWNLMARSENCFNCQLVHIEWRNDSLVFFFGKSKKNQTGQDVQHPWHVYSNPHNMSICPVLALARYLFSYPDILKDGDESFLFPGSNQYSRFDQAWRDFLNDPDLASTFAESGIDPKSLHTHSCRKGAISLVACGCTVSPPMAAICLRAMWSMGNVKDRYIHYEKAGDQFVGRSATGISSLIPEFAISPVYWDSTDAEEGVNLELELRKLIDENVVNTTLFSNSRRYLLQMLLASLTFHYEELEESLHPKHVLRSSPLFSAIGSVRHLHKYAVIRFPWNSTPQTPVFTGIPPHVTLLNHFQALREQLGTQTTTIVQAVKDDLNARGVGGDGFQAMQLLDQIKNSHNEMLERMNVVIAGVNGASESSRGQHPASWFNDYIVAEPLLAERDNDGDSNEGQDEHPGTSTISTSRSKGVMISWKNCKSGHIRLVNNSFVFPFLPFCNMMTMWYCGDPGRKIPPYKRLTVNCVAHLKSGKSNLSMMKRLVAEVHRAARLMRREDLTRNLDWNPERVIALYNHTRPLFAFTNLSQTNTRDKRRKQTISWKTYYNILSHKRKWKLMGELEGEDNSFIL